MRKLGHHPLPEHQPTLSASGTHTIVLVHPLNEFDYSAIYKRKFKQFKLLSIKMTTMYDVGNQRHKCGVVILIIEIPTLPFLIIVRPTTIQI